ncbi:MAG: OmpA family protein [Bryobacteraceae bacterium]
MKNLLLILAGLVAITALAYLCSTHHRSDIETDLTKNTTASLASAGLAVAKPTAEGQIITLRGEVPDEAAKKKAEALAYDVPGVSLVNNLLTVPPPITVEKKAAIDCQAKFNDLLQEPILFDTNRSIISRQSHALLDKLVEAAKVCPAAEIEVGGHTDSRGSTQKNKTLSENRAKAVVRYLTGKGLDVKRFSAVGYGESKPIADNGTAAGMAKNRRTEFKVKGI